VDTKDVAVIAQRKTRVEEKSTKMPKNNGFY